MIDLTLSK